MLVENLTARHFSRHPIILWVWLTGRLTRVIHYVRKHVGKEKLVSFIYRIAECLLFRGFQCIEVYVYKIRTVTRLKCLLYRGRPLLIKGCPLSGVMYSFRLQFAVATQRLLAHNPSTLPCASKAVADIKLMATSRELTPLAPCSVTPNCPQWRCS